jgi:hypothetical protein
VCCLSALACIFCHVLNELKQQVIDDAINIVRPCSATDQAMQNNSNTLLAHELEAAHRKD